MKVYGGIQVIHGRPGGGPHHQFRVIVAARSFAAAQRYVEAVGLFKPRRDYWGPTGNEQELREALARPGVVLARPLGDYKSQYTEVVSREQSRSTEAPSPQSA